MSPKPPKPARPVLTLGPRSITLPVAARVVPRGVARVTTPTLVSAGSEAEGLIRDIATRRTRIADDFYEIGVALRKLSQAKLYKALGYLSFDELLRARRVMSSVQAMKLVAVAQAYPKKLALRLGVEKGYALIRYTAATPAADAARLLAQGNARIGGKRVHDLSAKELRDQTKRLASGPAPNDAEVKAARRTASALQRRLRAKGAKSVKVRAEPNGTRWKLRLELDLSEAERLG